MLSGLEAISELPGLVRRILVHAGPRSLRTRDGIEVWPFARFAESVARSALWP
jgi:hypothetical protein